MIGFLWKLRYFPAAVRVMSRLLLFKSLCNSDEFVFIEKCRRDEQQTVMRSRGNSDRERAAIDARPHSRCICFRTGHQCWFARRPFRPSRLTAVSDDSIRVTHRQTSCQEQCGNDYTHSSRVHSVTLECETYSGRAIRLDMNRYNPFYPTRKICFCISKPIF